MNSYQQLIGIGQLIQWELECVVVKLLQRYDLPIVISENGLGAFDKLENGQISWSISYWLFKTTLKNLKKHVMMVVVYLLSCTWSYTDLLSWLNGYQKRYGFV